MRPSRKRGRLGSTRTGSAIIGAGLVFAGATIFETVDHIQRREPPWQSLYLGHNVPIWAALMGYSAVCAQPGIPGAIVAASITPPLLAVVSSGFDPGPPATARELLTQGGVRDVVAVALVGFGVWSVNRLVARVV